MAANVPKEFEIDLPTGNIFAFDPGSIWRPNEQPDGYKQWLDTASDDEVVNYIRDDIGTGLFMWNLEPGKYKFSLFAVIHPDAHPDRYEGEHNLIGVDSGSFIVADICYYKPIMKILDPYKTFTKAGYPSKAYSKKIQMTIDNKEIGVFTHVQSPGKDFTYEFSGDGGWILSNYPFKRIGDL